MSNEELLLKIHGDVSGISQDVKHLREQQLIHQKCVESLHDRVDEVTDEMNNVKVEQRIFKRDIKWTLGIGAAIIAAFKWIATLFR